MRGKDLDGADDEHVLSWIHSKTFDDRVNETSNQSRSNDLQQKDSLATLGENHSASALITVS